MDNKKCGTWIRKNHDKFEWECSICGFVRPDSLLKRTCDCCGSQMYLGEPENNHILDDKTIKSIESVLSKGDRVELIPVKDGIKIIHIKREELKPRG